MTEPQSHTRSAEEVLTFWFTDLSPQAWFRPDAALDEEVRRRFLPLYESLRNGLPEGWPATARGQLAAVVVLDQFPRNMFRGDAAAFQTDALALALAKSGVEAGLDTQMENLERQIFYLPFQHSEDPADQERSVTLNRLLGGEAFDWAVRHKAVIDRFGRFPARNRALGRDTTAEEAAFLADNPLGL